MKTDIDDLIRKRNALRKAGDYAGADEIRNLLTAEGYDVKDNPDGTASVTKKEALRQSVTFSPRLVVFGSGELSSVGRGIHESLIKYVSAPVKIALLETPAGYEDNPHQWYRKLKDMMEKGLINYKPEVRLVPALRKEKNGGTDDPTVLQALLQVDYIHTGAGSPSYAVRHLKDSLAIQYMQERLITGMPVSVASAAVVALSRYALPVYEIYFAGHDPSWIDGIDFFAQWGLNLTFLPHWNNTEGGKDIDTRFTYMGEKRFKKLMDLLPGSTTIIGIDEHTALQFDFSTKEARVLGKGSVTVMRGGDEKKFHSGEVFPFERL